ncbi:MAG: hypothetical protein ABFD92_13260 [Planctomycetaceae bacterium]
MNFQMMETATLSAGVYQATGDGSGSFSVNFWVKPKPAMDRA